MVAEVSKVSNIGPREQRKRRLLGIVALTVGVAAAFLLVVYDAPRALRAVVFFPVWIAGLGLLQARERTCIALAARGVCNLDAGEERLEDEQLVAHLRGTARRINRRALTTAVAITLLTLAFPRV
ncbi:MAG: hypothetical protein QOG00_1180 [Pyrinomonadaceae bacterium]|nr:hypothetical protein [Pyrinomonadaceae bacterium]MDX6271672.1 hypothetical protein [Acidobacteriota bacterium]